MILAGVDEAGRGLLAGPVVAAAVILTQSQKDEMRMLGLRDSKKMTPLRREKAFAKMLELGVVWRAQAAVAERIDRDNILRATLWAMRRAVERLPFSPDGVIVDGNQENCKRKDLGVGAERQQHVRQSPVKIPDLDWSRVRGALASSFAAAGLSLRAFAGSPEIPPVLYGPIFII